MSWRKQFAVAFLVVLIEATETLAQVAGGNISGVVSDSSGAAIPGARLSVKNLATDVTRVVSANGSGVYSAPNLLPGTYELSASAQGFATLVRTNLVIEVGSELVLNLELPIGSVKEKIEIVAVAPAIDLAGGSMSATANGTTIRELPLNGRSWTDLASLQPGVAGIETQIPFNQGAGRGNRGFGAQIAISGARPQQNNYRIDGISLNDYANGGPGSVLGVNLGVDAIQEFSVSTSNYTAEYGKTSGGVVNAITRSGTNEFHGSAYEFLRNSALDARNFFDRTAAPPPFKRNQFGVAAGAPLRRNRAFLFADYEGIRQSLGVTNVITVPSAAARSGQLSTGPVTVDSAVQRYLGLYPLPNAGLLGNGDTGVFTFAGQQIANENYFTGRVDYKLSDQDSLFGTYMFDRTPFTTPDSFNNVLTGSTTRRQLGVLEETHMFGPSMVNSLRFGVNRASADNNVSLSAINPLAGDTSLASMPGRYAAAVNIPGLTRVLGGLGGSPTYFFHFTSFQLYDDAFFTHGDHSLKFGFAMERMRDNVLALSNPNGLFNFSSLSNFLRNRPQRFQAGFSDSLNPRGLRQTLFGGYIQDDWRVHPNLMLNLGLRYEMSTVPTEVQGKLTTLRNITDAQPHLGSPYFFNPTYKNFEPRVGFSYDPFHNGKTALRGGFGIYDVLPLVYEFNILDSLSAPYFRVGNVTGLPAGTFPFGAAALLGPASLGQAYVEPNPRRNYVMQWNFNVQRELVKDLTLTLGYIGTRGIHQPFRSDDIDIVLPTLTPQGYLWPSPAGSGTRLNPNVGTIRALMWAGNSAYNALQTQIVKRLAHGFQVQGSFTWGKSIDTSSATLVGDAFGNSIPSMHWFNLKLNRGLSDFDISRVASINGIWDVPAAHVSKPLTWLANGWQFGGILKLSDGVPFTPILGGDPLGLNSTDPYAFPNRLTGPGCDSLINPGNAAHYVKTECFSFPVPATLRGNAGRNIMIGPGLASLDVSLFKNTRIPKVSEQFNTQFRAEVFNVLNRANFAPPSISNLSIFDGNGIRVPGAGLLDSTVTSSRQIQFALKLVW